MKTTNYYLKTTRRAVRIQPHLDSDFSGASETNSSAAIRKDVLSAASISPAEKVLSVHLGPEHGQVNFLSLRKALAETGQKLGDSKKVL
jgi:hypothetical protein